MHHHLSTSTDPKAPKTEMGPHQNMQNQDTHLILSSDPKPRLKWTPELHRRFADAVSQLGGADSYDHFIVCLMSGYTYTYT